jgi:hypothetical protein
MNPNRKIKKMNDLASRALAEFEVIGGDFANSDTQPFFQAWEAALAANGDLLEAMEPCFADDANPRDYATGKAALVELQKVLERVAPIRRAQHLITAPELANTALRALDPDSDQQIGDLGEGYTTKDELAKCRELLLSMIEDALTSAGPAIKAELQATTDPIEQRRIAMEHVRSLFKTLSQTRVV